MRRAALVLALAVAAVIGPARAQIEGGSPGDVFGNVSGGVQAPCGAGPIDCFTPASHPQTCTNRLDFSAACNSQYLVGMML